MAQELEDPRARQYLLDLGSTVTSTLTLGRFALNSLGTSRWRLGFLPHPRHRDLPVAAKPIIAQTLPKFIAANEGEDMSLDKHSFGDGAAPS